MTDLLNWVHIFIGFWKREMETTFCLLSISFTKWVLRIIFVFFFSILDCQKCFLVSKIENYFWNHKIRGEKKYNYQTSSKNASKFHLLNCSFGEESIYYDLKRSRVVIHSSIILWINPIYFDTDKEKNFIFSPILFTMTMENQIVNTFISFSTSFFQAW